MFEPYINYWSGENNNILKTGQKSSPGILENHKVTLLIHGYNNTKKEASGSYEMFFKLLLKEKVRLNSNPIAIYWPGANWEKALYYMQSIGQAEKTAASLANDLVNASKSGLLQVDIVAHSLGCRLTLETIKQIINLKAQDDTIPLTVDKVVLMAGAVPVNYLEDIKKLRTAITSLNGVLSLYSKNDFVLHYAFPPGQTLAGEGFFPVALGRKQWQNGSLIFSKFNDKENPGAGHSDYWGGKDENIDKKKKAVTMANQFLQLTTLLPRTPEIRKLTTRITESRSLLDARKLEKRR